MRNNQTLDFDGLRDEARAAYEAAAKGQGLNQTRLAADLDVTQSAISQALNNAGGKYAGLQRQIISALTDYEIVEAFRVTRKTA